MKLVVVTLVFAFLLVRSNAEAEPDPDQKNQNFGLGHVALLRNITQSLDASRQDKKEKHQKILEVSSAKHQELMKERTRLHEELKQDRAKQFEEIMKMGDAQHEEFKAMLTQIMKNIESTDAYKFSQMHMDLIKSLSKSHTEAKNENLEHNKQLQSLYEKQHAEIKNAKIKEAEEIKQERNRQFDALNKKRQQQEEEIKKMLQQVLSRLDEPRNCYELYQTGVLKNGIYLIKPEDMKENYYVYCDMESDGGGWTVIQRRGDFGKPAVNFRENWNAYANGFGKLTGEFWLGNEIIHHITKQKQFQLKIEMKDYQNVTTHFTFSKFALNTANDWYRISLDGSGTGQTDATFKNINGRGFSASDRMFVNCNNYFYGGWWYNSCTSVGNLNGVRQNARSYASITVDGSNPLSYVVMKIKPSYT